MDWIWQYYERAKAQLTAYIASFFALRSKILDQQDRADRLVEKARQTGDPILVRAAQQLQAQAKQLYADQAATEKKVYDAKDKIDQVDSSKDDSGLGVLPLAAIAAAAAVIVAAVSAVAIMFRRYSYLDTALDGLEKKILTPGEYATAVGGGGLFGGSTGTLLLVGGAIAAGWYFFGRRR